MTYSIESFSVPSVVGAGEWFTPAGEICCRTGGDQCREVPLKITIDEELIQGDSLAMAPVCADSIVTAGYINKDEAGLPNSLTDVKWIETQPGQVRVLAPGTYTIRMEVGTAEAETTLEVSEEGAPISKGGIEMTSCSIPSTIYNGDTITLSATLANNNDLAISGSPRWDLVSGVTYRADPVTIGAKETVKVSTQVTVNIDTAQLGYSPFGGTYSPVFQFDEDILGRVEFSGCNNITFETADAKPPQGTLEITELNLPSNGQPGQPFGISSRVCCNGGECVLTQYTITINNNDVLNTQVDLADQCSDFNVSDIVIQEPGTYQATAVLGSQERTAEITVQEPQAEFSDQNVTIQSCNVTSSAKPTDTVDLEATVANNNEADGSVSLRFNLGGNGMATDPVSVPAGQTKTIRTQYSLTNTGGELHGGDTVDVTVGVVSGDTTINTANCGTITIESTDDGQTDDGGTGGDGSDGTSGDGDTGGDGGDTGGTGDDGTDGDTGGSEIPSEGQIIAGIDNKITLGLGVGAGLVLLDQLTD